MFTHLLLTRSLSRLLYGTEDYQELIRLLSACEIGANPSYYDTSSRTYKDLINNERVVTEGLVIIISFH